jgi:hypothetical protein
MKIRFLSSKKKKKLFNSHTLEYQGAIKFFPLPYEVKIRFYSQKINYM